MKCPSCPDQDLRRMPYDRFHVLFCVGCQGHLVALRRVDELAEERSRPVEQLKHEVQIASWQESDEARKCPRCRVTMELKKLPEPADFNLETCRQCKLAWFDGSELARYQLAHNVLVEQRKAAKAAKEAEANQPDPYREWERAYDEDEFGEPNFLGSVTYMIREMFRK